MPSQICRRFSSSATARRYQAIASSARWLRMAYSARASSNSMLRGEAAMAAVRAASVPGLSRRASRICDSTSQACTSCGSISVAVRKAVSASSHLRLLSARPPSAIWPSGVSALARRELRYSVSAARYLGSSAAGRRRRRPPRFRWPPPASRCGTDRTEAASEVRPAPPRECCAARQRRRPAPADRGASATPRHRFRRRRLRMLLRAAPSPVRCLASPGHGQRR